MPRFCLDFKNIAFFLIVSLLFLSYLGQTGFFCVEKETLNLNLWFYFLFISAKYKRIYLNSIDDEELFYLMRCKPLTSQQIYIKIYRHFKWKLWNERDFFFMLKFFSFLLSFKFNQKWARVRNIFSCDFISCLIQSDRIVDVD